jgi:hypothetical protein
MMLAAALEMTWSHRVTGLPGGRTALVTARPFRVPHHAIPDVGLIGGAQGPCQDRRRDAHPEAGVPVAERVDQSIRADQGTRGLDYLLTDTISTHPSVTEHPGHWS